MTKTIERTDRAITRMYGRDPLRMIQGLVTSDVASAAADVPVYSVFLTPKGKMIGDARVIRRPGGEIWIEADRAALGNIEETLQKTVPPLFARAERLSDLRVIGVYGEHAEDVALNAELVMATSYAGMPGLDFVIHGEESLPGLPIMSGDELEMLRIEAGNPRWGAELTEDVIPLEAGLRQAAISENKGCYTGQEVIIRILHRGHVNRHLRGVLLGDQTVDVGAEIVRPSDQKVVGKVTSATQSQLLQQAIALAYIRREVEPGATVQVNGRDALVTELPFSEP